MTKFIVLFSILISTLALGQQDRKSTVLQLNQEITDLKISRNEEQNFNLNLKKDTYYSIVTSQKGIDLVVTLKDNSGKLIEQVDTPNGMFGPEKIVFSPDNSEIFSISVKPLDEQENSKTGKYSIIIKEFPKKQIEYTLAQLIQDFDILKNSLIETKVGLWYNTYKEFDSLCVIQKNKIEDKMTSLDLYKIIAPIVAYTKEGHSAITVSDETSSFIKQNYTFFPFLVKILEGKVYIINDLKDRRTKGMMISKINGKSIETIMQNFYTIEPADGYNITSKYHWIESSFSRYYTRFFPQEESFEIELINPKTKEIFTYKNISPVSFKLFQILSKKVIDATPNYSYKEASIFSIDMRKSTAFLTVNSFNLNEYKGRREGFKTFLDTTFKTISEQKIKNLVIDVRKNEGGNQGMEDYLLSYLTDKEYEKYKYVEIPSFTYSFLEYTNFKNKSNDLINDLKSDFQQNRDGQFLNMKGHYEGQSPNANNFKGNIYILTSGLTFSGGSEFAALAKNYTNAKFIGEETGGGYYGNTSGTFIHYTLPNTQLTGRIPLCKFVVETNKNETPFGRGLLPDYNIQPTIEEYLNGFDTEMEFIKKLINK